MEAIKTTARIHPLMAAAAVSVIIVSLAGAAAITGVLPSSHGAQQAHPAYAADTTAQASPSAGYAQPVAAAYAPPAVTVAQPAPVIVKETVIKEVPAKPKPHHASYARNDAPAYHEATYQEPAPRPAPQQPNYVAIGTGAVVGGLLGNQVGSGNGRKLATIAGLIGGGLLGNQISQNH